jgi:hypothetical protein
MGGESDELGPLAGANLDALLATICATAGLDARGAHLIKFTCNAVFRLASVPVVVRIAGSTAVRRRAEKVVRVARWLAEHDVPAVRLLPGIEQPITVDGQVATLWHAPPAIGDKPTAADLARILRRFHTLPLPGFDLPEWQPTRSIRERLAEPQGPSTDDIAFLVAMCDDLETALDTVRFELPRGPIHGDATVANLVSAASGPLICDFDSTCIGPREWDLMPVATGAFRFDPTGAAHANLAAHYGVDVTAWSGFPVLRRVRELQLVTSVLPVLRSNPNLEAQWRHRMRTLRNGDTTALWEPYR